MMTLDIIEASRLKSDGGALYGAVPKILWEKFETPDRKNRLIQAMRCLLIREGDRNILIDTGVGNYHDDKTQARYDLTTPHFQFDEALAAHGLTTNDISDVILTHLHYDHSGGLVTKDCDTKRSVFEKATIHIQKAHWQWANNPSLKDEAGYIACHLETIKNHPAVNFIDGPAQFSKNISLLVFNGHTKAMQLPLITHENQKYFFTGDLVARVGHLKLKYVMAYDIHPMTSIIEKQALLARAAKEKWEFLFQHDPTTIQCSAVKCI
jgi:glyoxylase-like metal-dependent hydrolase (beta-lactamase superfamily II)